MIARVAVGTENERAFRVTVNDKIIVHLLEFIRYSDRPEVPRDVTQQGISEIVGARRSHISLALSTLKERGMVEEKTVRVTDEVRRRKGYFLTTKGYESAKNLAESLRSRKVRVEDSGGVKEVKISELPELLGEKYYLVDVLCCMSRDGTLDLAQLTGQQTEPKALEEAKAPFLLAKTMAMCPVCRTNVEFPYDSEGMLTVVCGSCGNAFKVTVGAPVFPPQTQSQVQATLMTGTWQSRMRIGLMTLIAATVVSGTASLLMFTGVFILTCSFLIVTYPLLLVSLIDFKERYVRAQIAFSMILLFVAPFLAFYDYLRVFWVAMQFAGTFSLIAILAPMMIKPFRKRMALGITYAVAASLFPAIIPWGIPIGFGLLVACGALLAATAFTMQAREERDKEALAASILVAAFGAASYAHWIMFPGWEGWDVQAIVRIALITATLYAFAAFAKPVSAKIRSGVVSTLGVFLMAFGVFGATVPSSTAWPPDLGIYFIIFGGGALFIAMRMHKPAYVWSRVCLGVGLFIITMASISLVSRWPTLEMLWMAALGLWLVVGIAICTSQFLGHIADHVVAIRAGTIAAVGASVILAGVYMLMLGFGAEGAVELVLGVPLVGYAFIKSGAPWTSRMLMSVLFMTTVAVTWFAVIVNAF